MFHFQSFHMYGVLFSAIGVALIGVQLIRLWNQSAPDSKKIPLSKKELRLRANLAGGILFGLGWAVTGACPGPIYALVGLTYWPAVFVLVGALVGTYVYLLVKQKLPQ